MESKILIPIDKYRTLSKSYRYTEFTFDGTERFDAECGIVFTEENHSEYAFNFIVRDEKKWLLAKIKYGI